MWALYFLRIDKKQNGQKRQKKGQNVFQNLSCVFFHPHFSVENSYLHLKMYQLKVQQILLYAIKVQL